MTVDESVARTEKLRKSSRPAVARLFPIQFVLLMDQIGLLFKFSMGLRYVVANVKCRKLRNLSSSYCM